MCVCDLFFRIAEADHVMLAMPITPSAQTDPDELWFARISRVPLLRREAASTAASSSGA